jgi:hypothetical protein
MQGNLDRTLHWTDHYVEYGFAVIEGAVGPEFIKPAREEVQRLLETDLPPQQWPKAAGHTVHRPYDGANMTVLPQVYDQPGVRRMIDTMFGSAQAWNGERAFQLFVTAYNPEAEARLSPRGHIDFVRSPVPIFGSGFMFQLALMDSEPFSGNLTIYPGTHKAIQKALMEDPQRQYPQDLAQLLECEPFEFVAKAGDMIVFHHLVGHDGNDNHAAGRTPRVVLHAQGLRDEWLRGIDPAQPDLSVWERSLATNGAYRARCDEEQMVREAHRQRAGQ